MEVLNDVVRHWFIHSRSNNVFKEVATLCTRLHTHAVLPGGRYGDAGQVVGLEGGAAVLGRLVHCQLQLVAHRQGEQLLPQLIIICRGGGGWGGS